MNFIFFNCLAGVSGVSRRSVGATGRHFGQKDRQLSQSVVWDRTLLSLSLIICFNFKIYKIAAVSLGELDKSDVNNCNQFQLCEVDVFLISSPSR